MGEFPYLSRKVHGAGLVPVELNRDLMGAGRHAL